MLRPSLLEGIYAEVELPGEQPESLTRAFFQPRAHRVYHLAR